MLLALVVPGAVAIVVYAFAQDSTGVALAMSMLVAACAFALGALLGFLFGIPQYTAKPGETGKVSYQPNTNLTQVSDWLTKIIIGVGLVEFRQLAESIGNLGEELAPSFGGDDTAKWFGIALVVGFFVTGFLVAYLYTRLRLQWAFAQADRNAFDPVKELVAAKFAERDKELSEQEETDAKAVNLAARQLDKEAPAVSFADLQAAFSAASDVAKAQASALARNSPVDDVERARAQLVIDAIGTTPGT